MVLDQRDSEQGENKLYVKLGYLIIERAQSLCYENNVRLC